MGGSGDRLARVVSGGLHGQATETASPRILATNTAALRKQVGQEATVVGRISRTGQSKSGMQFLNFADSEFTVVCHEEDVAKFAEGVPVEAYRGQDVEITGTVELFRGKVQIRLREPSQIKIRAERQDADTKRRTWWPPKSRPIHAPASRRRCVAESSRVALSRP